MKNTFPFIYRIIVQKEHIDFFKEKLLQIVETSRKQASCTSCNPFQDKNEPHIFIIHELWSNMEDWRNHMLSPAAQELTEFAEKYNVKLTIHTLKKVV